MVTGVFVGLCAAPAQAAPVVTDWYSALPTGSRPDAIVASPDGTLYTVDSGSDSVSKILPDGSVDPVFRTDLPAGSLPLNLAQDARGAVYVTSLILSTVYRLDPTSGAIDPVFEANLGHALDGRHPIAVATDHDGEIYTLNSVDETVSRIAADGSQLDSYPLSATADSQALAFADDGDLFVANAGDHTVSRITFDARKHATVIDDWATLPTTLHPLGLAFDHHGSLYTVSSVGDTVSKISLALPPGHNVLSNLSVPGTKPFAIASDALGNVYTTDLGTNTVSLVAADGSVHSEAVSLPGTPFAESLTTGADGAVYLANSDTSSIVRVDLMPRIVSAAPPAGATVGTPYRSTVVATGLDDLRYSALGALPPGIHIDSATGELSGTPAGAGSFEVDLIAANALGTSAAQHVTITVALPAGSTGCWFWSEACGL